MNIWKSFSGIRKGKDEKNDKIKKIILQVQKVMRGNKKRLIMSIKNGRYKEQQQQNY